MTVRTAHIVYLYCILPFHKGLRVRVIPWLFLCLMGPVTCYRPKWQTHGCHKDMGTSMCWSSVLGTQFPATSGGVWFESGPQHVAGRAVSLVPPTPPRYHVNILRRPLEQAREKLHLINTCKFPQWANSIFWLPFQVGETAQGKEGKGRGGSSTFSLHVAILIQTGPA